MDPFIFISVLGFDGFLVVDSMATSESVQEQASTMVKDTVYHDRLTSLMPDLRNMIQMGPLEACLSKHGVIDTKTMQQIKVSVQAE